MSDQLDRIDGERLDTTGPIGQIGPAILDRPCTDNRYALRLRVLRALANLTQHAVANQAGISPEHYAAYESGQRRVTAAALMRLAPALGVTIPLFFEAAP